MKFSALLCALLLSFGALATRALAVPTPTPEAAAPASVIVPSPPEVEARADVLMDYISGQVLAAHEADLRLQPASLTKLMTSYIVFSSLRSGALKLQDSITISEHAWRAEGSRTFVQVGSQIPAEVLIKGMIVQSGNDATIALAEHIAGTEPAFVQLMNAYAKRLGMLNTHFDDSTGLPSSTHYTTAHDLALLARALVHDFPEYYAWFSIRQFVWNNIKQDNRNGLLGSDPSVDGLKTGHTDEAGFCLVTSAKRQGMRLIAVVLGSGSIKAREAASAALLNYGFTFFQEVNVRPHGAVVLRPRVYKGNEQYVSIGPASDINIVVPRGQAGSLVTSASVQQPLIAPLTTLTPVGQLQIVIDGKPLESVPLFPLMDVAEGGLWARWSDDVRLWRMPHGRSTAAVSSQR
jgi:serine-type D-Ala-D-Ala carboxypeptidase (penicillin-binding protein 5/6)